MHRSSQFVIVNRRFQQFHGYLFIANQCKRLCRIWIRTKEAVGRASDLVVLILHNWCTILALSDNILQVKDALVSHIGSTTSAPKEAWCAAHLNMLCLSAIDAYKRFGKAVETHPQRGMLVNYESLPGLLPRVILPELFHVAVTPSWLVRMNDESSMYSKARGSSRKSSFTGDSLDKDSRATSAIKKWGEAILQPTFDIMQQHMLEALSSLVPAVEDLSVYKPIPLPQVSEMQQRAAIAPSVALDPFSNIHNSTPFEVFMCDTLQCA